MDSAQVVTQHVFVRCAFPSGQPVAAELEYAADDPYAVRLTLFPEDVPAGGQLGRPVVHEVARTLLLQAVTGAAGTGAARAWPIVNEHGRALVVLHLTAPGHDVVLELLTTQLDRFLGRTRALVPLGTEGDHLDVDAVVDQLLATGA